MFKEGLYGLEKVVYGHFSAKKSLWSQSQAFVRIPPDADPGDRMLPGFGVDHG